MKPRKRTDTYPIDFTLKANGVPVNLTGYTVTINVVDRPTRQPKVVNGACTLPDPVNGRGRYTPIAGNVDTASAYDVEVKGVAPDGTIYHWPSQDYEPLYVRENLG